ncbi:MAG: hypothetical protein IJC55_03505 [Clostridia bacterium]|nr:hypothetical protein [Clostridia bacterium]
MQRKKTKHMNEAAWVLGVILCPLGVSLCTKANLGLSMIAAPAYILHFFLEQFSDFFSQGRTEYVWQAFLLLILVCIIRRFRFRYLLCFASAFISGMVLDGWLQVVGGDQTPDSMLVRILCFAAGECITALAIAFYFRTSLPLQIHELLVTEISDRFRFPAHKVKRAEDTVMLVISMLFAWLLNGSWQGIGIGTIVITLVNATLITLFGKVLDRFFEFDPAFPKITSWLSGKKEDE